VRHDPVMVNEVLEALNPGEGSVVVDGTAGAGGHSLHFAKLIGSTGKLFALDRDPAMAAIARSNLDRAFQSGNGPEIHVAATSYHQIGDVLSAANCAGADAILLDLGINSIQVDDPARGFSFSKEGPLDGRFNPAEPDTRPISELVNSESAQQLAAWIREYSDERHANRIAMSIVRTRDQHPFETTTQLAEVVRQAVPAAERNARIDPATRTMQALRIVANRELEILEAGLHACLAALNLGGRLACLSFHSGEDKLVKRIFDAAGSARPDPGNLYAATTREGLAYEVRRRGAIKPSAEEVERNPRSRSARLRVIERSTEGRSH